jgi:hypothetical protein
MVGRTRTVSQQLHKFAVTWASKTDPPDIHCKMRGGLRLLSCDKIARTPSIAVQHIYLASGMAKLIQSVRASCSSLITHDLAVTPLLITTTLVDGCSMELWPRRSSNVSCSVRTGDTPASYFRSSLVATLLVPSDRHSHIGRSLEKPPGHLLICVKYGPHRGTRRPMSPVGCPRMSSPG